jgi:hypothetical protein
MTRAAVLAVLLTALVAACAAPGPTQAPSSGPKVLPSQPTSASATASAAVEATSPATTVAPAPSVEPLTVEVFDPVNVGHWAIVATDSNLDGLGRASVDRKVGDEIQISAVCAGTGTIHITAVIVDPATDPADPDASPPVPVADWVATCPLEPGTRSVVVATTRGSWANINVDPSDASLRYDVIAATVVGG